jgi:hypothetical protein
MEDIRMRLFFRGRVAVAIIAAGLLLTAAVSYRAHKPAAPLRYYMECFSMRSVGNDINAEASQGWAVRAMVDHVGQDSGQECLLVLFERPAQTQ